jgi:hypothetical protein
MLYQYNAFVDRVPVWMRFVSKRQMNIVDTGLRKIRQALNPAQAPIGQSVLLAAGRPGGILRIDLSVTVQ